MTTAPSTAPSVHEAIAAMIGAMPAIAKDQRMADGPARYQYRGIEQIKAALKPLLAGHGIHYSAAAYEAVDDSEYQVRSGSVWQRTRITVRWRIYGPAGDHFDHVTRGEGSDSGDKATNKAMTAAEKYLLMQVFAIADAGADDPDADDPDEQVHQPPAEDPAVVAGQWERFLKGAILAALDGNRDAARRFWAEHQPVPPAAGWTEADGERLANEARAWAAAHSASEAAPSAPVSASEPFAAATPAGEPSEPPAGLPAATVDGEPIDLDAIVVRVNDLKLAEVRAELRDLGAPVNGDLELVRRRLIEALVHRAAGS